MFRSEPTTDPSCDDFGRRRHVAVSVRLAAIAAFLIFTNAGFEQRVVLLIDQGRWGTLIGYVGIWGLSLLALLVAAFQPRRRLRWPAAGVIALTTAVGVAYRQASGTDFGLFDAVSLWSARHEAARAMDFYASDFLALLLVLLLGFAVLAMPPVATGASFRRRLTLVAWAPAVPVVLIAAIVMIKEGGGAQALPTQFAPLSVAFVGGLKLVIHPVPERRGIALAAPGTRIAAPGAETYRAGMTPVRRVVLLVDESVRGDYIDWTPGNPYTPELARLRGGIVDFGPAVSGGNCSHYSNAILRFAAPRDGLGRELLANPTLWQYAKQAGFRTVFIDAQAAYNKNPGKLQNFMTREEVRDIDTFYTVDEGVPTPVLDDRLLDLMEKELRSDQPVFIYANKNGAHFPYDRGYPESERLFRPTMTEAGGDGMPARVNSYRNVLRWSVDRIFKRLFDEMELADTVILYTSDHGQTFNTGRLTHCSVEAPDPREALVPLFAISGDDALRARLAAAAEASRGHASHFSIAPTLLQLFGYDPVEITKIHGPSLLENNTDAPEFTTGDVFGLFATTVRRHPIDLAMDYLEPVARAERRFDRTPSDLGAASGH